MHVSFAKYEGLGNAFLLLDHTDGHRYSPPLSPERIQQLCDPHCGIGADGVIFVLPPKQTQAVATMLLFNANGGRAEISGNGLRCLALWLLHRQRVEKNTPCVIATDAGLRQVSFTPDGIRVEMGCARVEWTQPFSAILDFLDEKVNTGIPCVLRRESSPMWNHAHVTAVTLGNPHVIVHVPKARSQNLAVIIGKACQKSPLFPHGVNASVYKRIDQTTIELITYERGVGITPGCGSGACAAVAALIHRDELPVDREITVRQPGGVLTVGQNKAKDLWLTGPAYGICEGTVFLRE